MKQWQTAEKAKAQAQCTRKMDGKPTKLLVEVGIPRLQDRGEMRSQVWKSARWEKRDIVKSNGGEIGAI